jgi:Flp pilus assembly protein TadG
VSKHTDGFVTAEAAVVLPTLMVVTGLLVSVVVTVGDQLRCVDAARSGARLAARGESDARVRSAAAQVAPAGAQVAVVKAGGEVDVTVRLAVRPTHWLPALHLSAHAVLPVEPP